MTAQNMGKKILTEAGYDIIAVSNGAAALKKIAELKPDIAILDVFMPGYTGPEVCERIKNVHETSKIPVLLTVGKMEMTAFKPEETNRVKADGLIIKPFEATDLIALIQKLEKKLAPAKPLPTAFEGEDNTSPYEKTVKLDLREFRDASYDQWKSTAEEHRDEGAAKKPDPVPSEMAGAPAFTMDEPAAPVASRTTQVLEKGQTAMLESPVAPEYSSTIQLPPPKPMATAATVPDWAVQTEPAAEIAPVEEPAAPVADEIPDASSRESGVGKLLSKAKGWFGTSAEEAPAPAIEEKVAAAEVPDVHAMESPKIAAPAPDFAAPPDWGAAPAMEMESAPEIPVAEVPFEAPASFDSVPHIEAPSHHSLAMEHTIAPHAVEMGHAIDPALDTSMHRESYADVAHEIDPALDTSMHRDTSEVASGGLDPALVTDPSAMASAFPTNFGIAGATIDPVGVAADVPGLYDSDHDATEAAVAEPVAEAVAEPVAEVAQPQAEEPLPSWRAEEHHLEDHEHGRSEER